MKDGYRTGSGVEAPAAGTAIAGTKEPGTENNTEPGWLPHDTSRPARLTAHETSDKRFR
jgi:hypothetical protein